MTGGRVAGTARRLARRALRRTSAEHIDYARLRPPYARPDRVRALSATPADESFITGNGVAAHCRHVLNFDLPTLNESGRDGWWFCKADYLDWLFDELAPREPYVLFSHNSDRAIDARFRRRLDDPLLRAWFAQNPTLRHPKLHALPIGVANPFWAHGDQAALRRVQADPAPKTTLVDVSFNPDTNPAERRRCLAATGLELAPRLPYEDYLRRLAGSFFCVSPNGNGIDCVRTWEALYVRTIPIVTRSLVTEQHAWVPMLVLDDWSQLRTLELSPELYERIWNAWDPAEIRLDRYLERVERIVAASPS